jgi:hypothetical protein
MISCGCGSKHVFAVKYGDFFMPILAHGKDIPVSPGNGCKIFNP